MSLPTSYMTGSFTKIPSYFDAMLAAKAPDKFTTKFMADLGFNSSNDRQFVNVLKAIGFLDDAGTPTQRYFTFLDQSRSKQMVAEGVREAYKDLFALNTNAHTLKKDEIVGKFKTITNGSKEAATIGHMASTFLNLCSYAEWTPPVSVDKAEIHNPPSVKPDVESSNSSKQPILTKGFELSYDIHIHLPTTRDTAVYDALFSGLAKHISLR